MEIRTPDPLVANEVLYQLSYRPLIQNDLLKKEVYRDSFLSLPFFVGDRGVEPRTSSLSVTRSNHLS